MEESIKAEQPTTGSGWRDAFTSSNSGTFATNSCILLFHYCCNRPLKLCTIRHIPTSETAVQNHRYLTTLSWLLTTIVICGVVFGKVREEGIYADDYLWMRYQVRLYLFLIELMVGQEGMNGKKVSFANAIIW